MLKIQSGTSMIIRLLFSLILVCLTGTGCNLIYKQNIQQGNALEQDDLDELYIGMNQRQVLFVLGTPSIKDPFNHDRWDYVQTFSRRGNPMISRTVTLRFEDGLLANISGENDPFGANSQRVDGDPDEVASFVKKPATSQNTSESPQDAAIESAKEEVIESQDPDIKSINERTSEDRDYQKNMELLDQTPGDLSGPDIDG
jgi:outer membrane protein assembly factor BamE (lipoprotein component of BamABCDE complex)